MKVDLRLKLYESIYVQSVEITRIKSVLKYLNARMKQGWSYKTLDGNAS